MAFRLYVMPMIIDTDGVRKPKYAETVLAGSQWACMDFGWEPLCVLGADLTAGTDSSLTANADVQALPVNLDQNLTVPAVTTVHDYLEAHNLPADWVNIGYTYRQVVRIILGVFIFFQRFIGIYGQTVSVFTAGVTLDSTFGSLPAGVRTAMQSAATSLSYSTTGITGSTSMRALMKAMADQAAGKTINIGGVSI